MAAERKVHLISLGCARNRVDSEVMLGSMIARGWKISENIAEADAVVVNTCGFIASAKEESIDTILDAASYKKQKPHLKLVVTGCLTQRYKSQLAQGLPEVDLFIGTDEFPKIADLIDSKEVARGAMFAKRTHYLYTDTSPRVNTLAKHSAYVKVAEGCQHNCAFCIIPAIRGKLRSRPIASVLQEVEVLVKDGVKEINLIAQDLAAYGRERPEMGNLLDLLKALVKIDGLEWIRLLYMYPENISDDFLEFMAQEPKIVKYLDIPMQHASDRLLKAMNRGVTRLELEQTIQKVRARIPGIAIRTSVMVGFPGETDEDFAILKDFVTKQRLEHLGCFTYSKEEGTVAGRMPDQIDDEVKKARQAEIMEIQREVSADNLARKIGQEFDILVEGVSEETELLWQGRLSTQAPEVDGVVYINDGKVEKGQIQRVVITETHDYDLVGHIVSKPKSMSVGTTRTAPELTVQ
jgi:ribosomal protein S12 methylthiotransferase